MTVERSSLALLLALALVVGQTAMIFSPPK